MFSLALTHLLYIAVVVQCGFPAWVFGKSAMPSSRLGQQQVIVQDCRAALSKRSGPCPN